MYVVFINFISIGLHFIIIRSQLNQNYFHPKRGVTGKEGGKWSDCTRWYNPKDGKREGIMNILNKTREAIYYNVTLRPFCATIVAVEKQ
jgi:hypothetical protein